jgi:glycosyltransferase involved in cell wall biosynthesis
MKSKVLIGPMNVNDIGSIPSLNRAFINGLSSDFEFIPFNTYRKHGKSKLAKFNVLNIFYFFKQYTMLIYLVIRHKPTFFHYSINSNWSMEKSLLFLNTAKFFGTKKAIGHLHGGAFNVFMDSLKGPRKRIAYKLFFNVDAVIVASEFWKEYLTNKKIQSRFEIVNNPIALDYIAAINASPKIDRNDNFLFIGALGQRKGIYDIIEVCKTKDVDFTLDAIGSEDIKNDLKKINTLIKENEIGSKLNIIISEKLSLKDKVKYFSESQVFFFPTHNENFPLVIIEAACAGIPIISTPVGAIPEFFTHMEDIYFVEPGNIHEITKAIHFMKTNVSERERLGKAARHTYETKLSNKIIMDQLKKVYKAL